MEKLNKRQLHRPLQPEVVVVGLPAHPSPSLGPKGEGKIQALGRQNLGVPGVASYTHPSVVSRAGKESFDYYRICSFSLSSAGPELPGPGNREPAGGLRTNARSLSWSPGTQHPEPQPPCWAHSLRLSDAQQETDQGYGGGAGKNTSRDRQDGYLDSIKVTVCLSKSWPRDCPGGCGRKNSHTFTPPLPPAHTFTHTPPPPSHTFTHTHTHPAPTGTLTVKPGPCNTLKDRC